MQEEIGQEADASDSRLAQLYVRHAPDAVRLAYLLTGDHALAEDMVQEAFVRLAGRFADLRNPDAFTAYLRKTVVNLSRMHFRHRKVERMYLERAAAQPRIVVAPPDVAEYDAMKSALLDLPERQRTALVLRFYEDLSEHDTAEMLGCRPGTVKSLVSRGLEALREQMGESPDG